MQCCRWNIQKICYQNKFKPHSKTISIRKTFKAIQEKYLIRLLAGKKKNVKDYLILYFLRHRVHWRRSALGLGWSSRCLAPCLWTLAWWWICVENYVLLVVGENLECSWNWRQVHIYNPLKDLNNLRHWWPASFIILNTPTSKSTNFCKLLYISIPLQTGV